MSYGVQPSQPTSNTILNAPLYVSNYTTHNDLNITTVSDVIKSKFQKYHGSTLIFSPHPFPIFINLLTQHVDYAGSGPGIFSCERYVSEVIFQSQKASLMSGFFHMPLHHNFYNIPEWVGCIFLITKKTWINVWTILILLKGIFPQCKEFPYQTRCTLYVFHAHPLSVPFQSLFRESEKLGFLRTIYISLTFLEISF